MLTCRANGAGSDGDLALCRYIGTGGARQLAQIAAGRQGNIPVAGLDIAQDQIRRRSDIQLAQSIQLLHRQTLAAVQHDIPGDHILGVVHKVDHRVGVGSEADRADLTVQLLHDDGAGGSLILQEDIVIRVHHQSAAVGYFGIERRALRADKLAVNYDIIRSNIGIRSGFIVNSFRDTKLCLLCGNRTQIQRIGFDAYPVTGNLSDPCIVLAVGAGDAHITLI